MKISIIIPAYNEEKHIKPTIDSVCEYLNKKGYDYEVIIINDGSQDDTRNIVETVKLDSSKAIKLINNSTNRGKGAVVKQGILEAIGDVRLFMDADNSTNIDQFDRLLLALEEGYDIAVGSRRIEGAKIEIHQSWHKEKLGQLANLWIRLWVVGGFKDTQAGFKIFTREAVEKIFPKMTLNRWGFDFELLAIAKKNGLKIKEVPVLWRNSPMSRVKILDYIKALLEAIKVRLNILFGKYN